MKAWEPIRKLESFYSGGKIFASGDLASGYSLIGGSVVNFDTASTKVLSRIGTGITNFTMSDSGKLITYAENDMLTYHDEKEVTWKSNCTVLVMQSDKRGLLATGASDNSVRVYQIAQGYLTHKFKHKQPVTAVAFIEDHLWVVSAALDNTLKVWDLTKYNCLKTITLTESLRGLQVHDGKVFAFSPQGVSMWGLQTWNEKKYEGEVTAMGINQDVYIGDSTGTIKKLSAKTLMVKKTSQISKHPITALNPFASEIVACNEESTVYFINDRVKVKKEYLGHIDEVLDIKWLDSEKILIAVNSSEAKIFTLSTSETLSLQGHTDNILCLDVQGNNIITGSKDQTIRLWDLSRLLATYKGHTEDVTSICFSKKTWFVSASIDQTLKIWAKSIGEVNSAAFTCVAHSKDISVVRVSIDNKLIVSGSQDKLIKLWTNKLKPIRELVGHKRGIWDLSFNKTERLLCSSSGDMTVKIWSLEGFECIRTLEGFTNSVLKALFFGNSIISTGSDGLVKVWDYKTGTCHVSLDEHTGKVWGLAENTIDNQCYFLTGATDSLIILWKDITVQQEAIELEAKREMVKLEQTLQNELSRGHFVEAALIAFKLKRPQGIYNIVQQMNQSELTNFVDGLVETTEGVMALLTHIRDWNCFKKYTPMAQRLLVEVFDRIPVEQFPDSREVIQGIITYSMKHFARAERLYMDSFLVEHLMNEIALLPSRGSTEDGVIAKRAKVEMV